MSSAGIAIIIVVAMVGFMLLEVFLLSIISRNKRKAYMEERSAKIDSNLKIQKISVKILRVAAILNMFYAAFIFYVLALFGYTCLRLIVTSLPPLCALFLLLYFYPEGIIYERTCPSTRDYVRSQVLRNRWHRGYNYNNLKNQT